MKPCPIQEVNLTRVPPLSNCRECGLPHAGYGIRCPRCEAQYQREQRDNLRDAR